MDDAARIATLQDGLEESRRLRKRLDRQLYQTRVSHEALRELAGQEDAREILRIGLLHAVAGLTAQSGFVLFTDPLLAAGAALGRGLDEDDTDKLQTVAGSLDSEETWALLGLHDLDAPGGRLVARNVPAGEGLLPRSTRILVRFATKTGCVGLLGLGPKVDPDADAQVKPAPYSDHESDLCVTLADHLVQALDRIAAQRSLAALNAHLRRRNTSLDAALQSGREARGELDRRVFQLNSLYDATLELSGRTDPDAISRTFLMLMQGVFSAESAYLLVLHQEDHTVRFFHRAPGGTDPTPVDFARAERFLFACISTIDFAKLQPLSPQLIDAPVLRGTAPDGQAPPLPAVMGALFRLDDTSLGIAALGGRLSGAPFAGEDRELFLTHTANFLVFLKNALSFETIHRLNDDLAARNAELVATIEELTASKRRIEVLEVARERLRSMIHSEAERVDRPHWRDLAVIVFTGVLLGVLFNFSNPHGVALIPETLTRESGPAVTPEKALAMLDAQGAVLVDARAAAFYDQSHAEGAVNMPPSLFDFIYAMRFGEMDLETPILVYGRDISSRPDEEVAWLLRQQGHEQVFLVEDGLEGLLETGHPAGG